jgi:hypothetical protein
MKRASNFTVGAVLAAFALAAPAAAQDQGTQDNISYGGTSGEFLLLGAGARGLALGGAYAALTTDVSALYYNPAGLAQMERPGLMISSYSYVAETQYFWGGAAFPLSGGSRALGISLGSFGFGDQPIYTLDDPDNASCESYGVRQTYVSGSYAQNFSDRFSAGLSVKFISDQLGDVSADAFALDFGTNFHAMVGQRAIRAAFTIQNLGTSLKHDGQALNTGVTRTPPLGTVDVPQEEQPARLRASEWPLPVMFRVGVAFDAVSQAANRITVLGEFTQPNNTKPGAALGLEWMGTNLGGSGFSLAARGSYTINPDNNIDDVNLGSLSTAESTGSFTSDGMAVGGGVMYGRNSWLVGFDYAYKSFGPLGGTNNFSFSLSW